jgi:hypothetical protein
MVAYDRKKYKFIRFSPGRYPKKYNAILGNTKTKREVIVPFGDQRYQQYRDSTKLNLYTHLDHRDKTRRKNYKKRHQHDRLKDWSSGYFSMKYLW